MSHSTADKAKVRTWMARPRDPKPQPTQEQLKRELGFELILQERQKRYRY